MMQKACVLALLTLVLPTISAGQTSRHEWRRMEVQRRREVDNVWKKRRQLGKRVMAKLGYDYLVATFYEGIATVERNNDTMSTSMETGFVNAEAEFITDFVYNIHYSAGYFWKGFSMVERKGKSGYIDRRGQEVIPAMYDRAHTKVSGGLAAVALDGKWGFVDTTNRVIVPFVYADAYTFDDSLAAVKLGTKWGVINRVNHAVIPFVYDSVLNYGQFGEGVLGVVLNGKAGAVDVHNRVVIPFRYSPDKTACWAVHYVGIPASCYFNRGIAFVHDDQCRIGAVDHQGREVIPLRYHIIYTNEAEGQITAIDEDRVEHILYYPAWLALPDR